jgi:Fe-S-cluster containining protein
VGGAHPTGPWVIALMARSAPWKPVPRDQIPAGQSVCDYCIGKCCRYFSLPIKTPVGWDDYDEMRWFLAHGETIIYLEKGTWYLLVMAPCQYLQADHRCAIYDTRPQICRDYENDDCEYEEGWKFERVFECPEQMWEYAEAVLPPRRKPERPAPKPAAPPVVQIGSLPGPRR